MKAEKNEKMTMVTTEREKFKKTVAQVVVCISGSNH